MNTTKQINITNRTYYFYNDIIDIENFDTKLLKIDKKSHKTLIFLYNHLPDLSLFLITFQTSSYFCHTSSFLIKKTCFFLHFQNILCNHSFEVR